MESFLLLTQHWQGYSLGYRLMQEGYVVKAYVDPQSNTQGPTGCRIPTLRNPFQLIEQFDCVICDTASVGEVASKCIEKGAKVIGGNSLAYRLLDPEFNLSVLGILYGVIHPLTDQPVLIASAWFDGETFRPNCYTQARVHTRMMDGELGCAVHGSGVVLQAIEVELFNDTLTELLTKSQYRGMVSVTYWMDGEVPRPVALDLSINPTITPAYFELVKDLGEFLLRKESLRSDRSMALLLSRPPFPYESAGQLGLGELSSEALRHVHPTCLNYCYVSGRGQTLNEARRRVYRAVELLNLPKDVQYRLDIGKE